MDLFCVSRALKQADWWHYVSDMTCSLAFWAGLEENAWYLLFAHARIFRDLSENGILS